MIKFKCLQKLNGERIESVKTEIQIMVEGDYNRQLTENLKRAHIQLASVKEQQKTCTRRIEPVNTEHHDRTKYPRGRGGRLRNPGRRNFY